MVIVKKIAVSTFKQVSYPGKLVDFLLQSYFRSLDGIFHKKFENVDIKQFHVLINSLVKGFSNLSLQIQENFQFSRHSIKKC